jgi:two-component system capsular synthesis sensor histidine kinase RcsC
LKYLVSFHTTLKVSRYLFQSAGARALAADCVFSVFYIVNALHQKEAEIRQEFN